MATATATGRPDNSEARRRAVDWPTVLTSGTLALVPVLAILVSLFILHGQTTARIDSTHDRIDATRVEVAAGIEAARAELVAKADATNARIDDVLLALSAIGTVAADIDAMRADLARLAENPR